MRSPDCPAGKRQRAAAHHARAPVARTEDGERTRRDAKTRHPNQRDGVRKENYRALLELARDGRIKPTAGAGIGLERLIAWLCGAKHVCDVQPFPRIPGFVGKL